MDLKASFQYPITDTLLRGDAKIEEKKGLQTEIFRMVQSNCHGFETKVLVSFSSELTRFLL